MRIVEKSLTFDDVSLIPEYSEILPREVSTATKLTNNISLHIPLLSAPMDTVTETKLAITLAQEGGLGIIHKNMPLSQQAKEVRNVKKYESGVVKDAITISPDATVRQLIALTKINQISGVPVIENGKVVGIVTNRDFRFETNLDLPVSQLMTAKSKLITVTEGTPREHIIQLLHKHRIEKVLVINKAFELRGLVTVKDIQKAKDKPYACKDDHGRLRVGAAVGTGGDTEQRVEALVQAEVDVIVVDTAHGHSKGVLERIKWIKQRYPDLDIIGGNVATADAAKALQAAGVDAVKVGIGPGSICTTRIVAGVGVPQITAISNVANVLKGSKVKVIADGGIRHSGDITKAIVAGADSVMIGGLFAGTEEAPGEIELYQGRSYKSYRGMGSLGAMAKRDGSSDRYFQDLNTGIEKLVPEGIEGRVAYKGSLLAIIHQLVGGLRSGMGYTGCATIEQLQTDGKFVRVTPAGNRESHVHDVTITKEAPNYQGND